MSQDPTGSHGEAQKVRSGSHDAIFAARIRTLRLAANLTQAELAERVSATGPKMHRSAIAKIEAGDRVVPVGEATRLARVLGVSLDDLVTPAGPREREQRELIVARAKVTALAYEVMARGHTLREAEMLLDDANVRLQQAQARLAELDPAAWRQPGSEDDR